MDKHRRLARQMVEAQLSEVRRKQRWYADDFNPGDTVRVYGNFVHGDFYEMEIEDVDITRSGAVLGIGGTDDDGYWQYINFDSDGIVDGDYTLEKL